MIYQVYTDGACRGNPGKSGAGAVIVHEDGHSTPIKQYIGVATNNVAEYCAVVMALKYVGEMCTEKPEFLIFSDSKLLVNQVNGAWRVKSADIIPLFKYLRQHTIICAQWIPREQNQEADRLANEAIDEYETSQRLALKK